MATSKHTIQESESIDDASDVRCEELLALHFLSGLCPEFIYTTIRMLPLPQTMENIVLHEPLLV